MLKKLRSQFFLSEIDKQLQRAKINKTHDFVQPKYLNQLVGLLSVGKTKNQLINSLYKKLHSTDNTIKVKVLIAIHAIIRKTFDEEFCDLIMNEQTLEQANVPDKTTKTSMQSYTRENIINFYLIYLKKICIQKESYLYVKRVTKKQIETQYTYRNDFKHQQNIELVTHGFKILNLTNYILQSQQMFNKMGRYHFGHEEIISMYMQLLEDLNLFNSYIKIGVKIIMDRNNQSLCSVPDNNHINFSQKLDSIRVQYQKSMKKDKMGTSATQAETSCIAFDDQPQRYTQQQAEETKHQFLFVYECQKVSDRLYQYYHNRYYYKVLKNLIVFPTFLVIENKQYSRIKNKTKRVDKNLVNLVKRSKYQGQTTMVCDSIKTEPAIKMNRTFAHQKPHFTELDQNSLSKDPYRNISYNFMRGKAEQVVHEIEQY